MRGGNRGKSTKGTNTKSMNQAVKKKRKGLWGQLLYLNGRIRIWNHLLLSQDKNKNCQVTPFVFQGTTLLNFEATTFRLFRLFGFPTFLLFFFEGTWLKWSSVMRLGFRVSCRPSTASVSVVSRPNMHFTKHRCLHLKNVLLKSSNSTVAWLR